MSYVAEAFVTDVLNHVEAVNTYPVLYKPIRALVLVSQNIGVGWQEWKDSIGPRNQTDARWPQFVHLPGPPGHQDIFSSRLN